MDGGCDNCIVKFGFIVDPAISFAVNLNDSVEYLPYVGKTYGLRLKRLKIESVWDLLYHFPTRYRDFSQTKKIKDLFSGEEVSISGEILEITNVRTKTGKFLTMAVVHDETGAIVSVWFNKPYLARTLKPGIRVGLAGRVEPFSGRLSLISPEFEVLRESFPTHTAGLVPIYPETARVSSKWLRNRIKYVLKTISAQTAEEFIPNEYLQNNKLPSWGKALSQIHFPPDLETALSARERFAFEELLLFNLRSMRRRAKWNKRRPPVKISVDKFQNELDRFIQNLPFELTPAQKKVMQEILSNMEKTVPMNRMLEGDVGSGKTVVAAVATYLASLCGAKTILMAPTEVLADQHFNTLKELLEPYGLNCALHTGSKKPSEPDEFDIWIGTHALFYKKENFKKVGLVVIDEQHRFGVEQRASLLKKVQKGTAPHVLTLTATPIPQTLALTVYGDLDVSILDELPPGRKKVKTFVVPEEKRDSGYRWIHERVKGGDQAFVICPLVEESEKESMQSVKAAAAEAAKLKDVFPDLKIGLLHGRMKSAEKTAVLEGFKAGQTHVLVSTPVVEVGIDIPGATIMVVEAAERFGLASLHQLRGRVGRGKKESYCFLFSESESEKVLERLKALEKNSNGFDLAELDLKLRGPGEIYGTAQHGLNELKVADLTDTQTLKKSQAAAKKIIESDSDLKNHPLILARLTHLSSDKLKS